MTVSASGAQTVTAATDSRPTIAIVGFETIPGGWVLPPPQLGTTIAELFVDRLVTANPFHVLDGQWLSSSRRYPVPAHVSNTVLRPVAQTPYANAMDQLRADAQAAGVDYLVLGAITRFSNESRQRSAGGGGFRVPILGGFRRNKTEMVVSVVVRVVSVRSG